MKTVSFIPIKLNNESVTVKNLLPFSDGKPLIYFVQKNLLELKRRNVIDEIYVFCSDESIQPFLLEEVKLLLRPKELDVSTVKGTDIYKTFVSMIESDIYVLAHATSPFVTAEHIKECIDAVKLGEYDSAFCSKKIQNFLWKDNKPLNFKLNSPPRTQDMEPIYMELSTPYIFTRLSFEKFQSRTGKKPYICETSEIEAIDIDYLEDFKLADVVYTNMLCKNKRETDGKKDEHIRLLDCTLRDGGHINQGEFGEAVIRNIIKRLVEAKIDIIEVGFLWNSICNRDTARFYSIEEVKRILPEECGESKFCLMADFIDLNHLEPCDGTIEYIRLSFKRWRLDWALETAKILKLKGYKVFINPVNNNVYTDKQYIEVLEKVNEIKPYGFSIVDTFGVMRKEELMHRYLLVENNLLPEITVGIHLHENLGLAFSLAQHITLNANMKRKIVIDGSLLGMGRVPGNLCIEQFAEYYNNYYYEKYYTSSLYDAIDDYIQPIKNVSPWGYAIPYALSAKYHLHRTYAEFLMNKQRLRTKDIQIILSQVDPAESEIYNEKFIEDLYDSYLNVEYNDTKDRNALVDAMSGYSKIVILAPGKTIDSCIEKIKAEIDSDTYVISVNFNPKEYGIKTNAIFLGNAKRYIEVENRKSEEKLIITSNLKNDIIIRDYVMNYNNLSQFNDTFCDDSSMMLLNLLLQLGCKDVLIAGFDGIKNGRMDFFDKQFKLKEDINAIRHNNIINILLTMSKSLRLHFITHSEYEEICGSVNERMI